MKLLLQAGHSAAFPPYYPNGGGAIGEAAWTTDLARRSAARLTAAGVEVVLVGHWYGLPPPAEAARDYDVFVSLHYDGSLDRTATGCCAGRATLDPMGAAADVFLGIWTSTYPAALGIPLKQERVGANIRQYYAFEDTSEATPGILLEHGYGNCADHDILFDRIDEVAAADVAAILAYLDTLRHPIWSNTAAPLTQAFGGNAKAYKRYGLIGHNGHDYGMPVGTPLHAPEAGLVLEAFFDAGGYGNTVYVAGDSGNGWRLGHLDTLVVSQGLRVEAQAMVGTSGDTGNSTGPHLHLGMRPPDANLDNGYNGYVDPTLAVEALRDPSLPPLPPTPQEVAVLEDWQVIQWVLAPLYEWAGIPFNPDAGTAKAWVRFLREGHYLGRPRTEERPYGAGDEAGVWQEYDYGCLWYRLRDGNATITG